ncbi:hypothetical protein LCGC14_2077070 [marine sediment metagenome]|uniref:Uncharacterized protein n=1 Tax=marine sediment metagenome TaxID=412755 RepID=A0A0F9HDM7_9ZZZZ
MNKELFNEKLEKLNKKLAKYNENIKVLSTTESSENNFIEVTAEISEPKITGKKNVEYIGMVSFKNGIREIYNINSNFILGDLEDEKFICEHCNINRYRTRFFFFLEDGKLKSIGSTCVDEYFGYNILKMLHVYTIGSNSLANEKGFKVYQGTPLDILIWYTAYVTNNFNAIWKSQEKYEYESTISDVYSIQSVLKELGYNNSDSDVQGYVAFHLKHKDGNMVKETKKLLLEKYKDFVPKNDFEHNIKNNLFYDDGTLRDSIIKEGIIAWTIWKINNDLKKVKLEKFEKESEFVGTVGEKFEDWILSVRDTFDLMTQYGYCQLVIFNDEIGNTLKWFNSGKTNFSVGDSYKLKGTIKKHEDYLTKNEKIIKTTVITRCKIID